MAITINRIVPTSDSVIVSYGVSNNINQEDFMTAVVNNIGQLINNYALVRNPKMGVDMDIIEDIVCREMNISPSSMNSKSRNRKELVPRQIAHYMAKKFTSRSLSEIGGRLGKRNHATVLHSINTVNDVWLHDPQYEDHISNIDLKLIKLKVRLDKKRLEVLINEQTSQ